MSEDLGKKLLSAIRHGRTQEALALLEKGANVNYVLPDLLDTPLLLAIETGNKTLIRRLVEKGANVNYILHYPKSEKMISLSDGLSGHGYQTCPLTRAYEQEELYDLGPEIEFLEAHGAKELCELV